MRLNDLKTLLDKSYPNNWVIDIMPKEIGRDNDFMVLTFIDATPIVADDGMQFIQSRYQLVYYNSDPNITIDSFFIKNNIILSNKQQVYLKDFKTHQNIYEFYIMEVL